MERVRFQKFLDQHKKQSEIERHAALNQRDATAIAHLNSMPERAERAKLTKLCSQRAYDLQMLQAARDKDVRMRMVKVEQQERDVAQVLQQLKVDELRDEKLRQRIRENSHELRELEQKLKAAHTAKCHQTQIAEKRASKFDEQLEEIEFAKKLADEQEEAEATRLRVQQERACSKEIMRKELHEQLAQQIERRKAAEDQKMLEKLQVDEVLRKIFEEDKLEREREKAKRETLRKHMLETKQLVAEAKQREKERLRRENEEIKEYMAFKEQDEAERAKSKQEKVAAFSALQTKLAMEMHEKEKEREERLKLYELVATEEVDAKIRQEENTRHARKIAMQEELRKAKEDQLKERAIAQAKIRAEEEEFKNRILAKFAEDDRLEQMEREKARLRKIEHRREADRLLEERRRAMLEKIDRQRAELAADRESQQLHARIVEEERLKILKERAADVLGYLPKGVIRNEEDLEALGPAFQNEYRRHIQMPDIMP